MATRLRVEPSLQLPPEVRLMNLSAAVLAAMALLLLAGVGVTWLARQPLFAIRVISVEGDVARNSVATLRANVVPQLAGSFFSIDLGTVRRAFESVPWVRKAVVQRAWPNRLRVRLEEHRVAAIWDNPAGAEKLVDRYGDVFEANVEDVDDLELPHLGGPPGSSAHALAMLGRVDTALAALGSRVETLSQSARGSWQATLEQGAVIELGRGSDDEVAARAGRFASTVAQVTARYQHPLEHADLRHADGYAVRLRGVSTTPPAAERAATKKNERR
ncbi:MAG: cell division protein FtsQ/DivIB [Pseudomonadota bacterium]|nr:cell division protein FtsQ/DivIB [Pseudomonadota bacterium]